MPRLLALTCCVGLLGGSLHAEQKLVLSRTFVEQVKNTAAIDLTQKMQVQVFPKGASGTPDPHPIDKGGADGDIHMACHSVDIGLPMVAEIVNARLSPDAMKALSHTPPTQEVAAAGVWRVWFEHPGGNQIQGTKFATATTPNPPHVFEMHPLTSFENVDLRRSSFAPIASGETKTYVAYRANVAFPYYEKQQATIESNPTAIAITSNKSQYNYTEFIMELAGEIACTDAKGQQVTGSGSASCAAEAGTRSIFVLANIFDSQDAEGNDPLTAKERRMVFVAGTEPADRVAKLSKGGRLHVMGIPRVNLAEVAAIPAGKTASGVLPYEMIIVAVLPD